MEWLILVALVFLVVLVALTKKGANFEEFPYALNKQLFSPAERSFFGILNQAVKGEAVVLGKVRVADIINPAKGLSRSNWQKAFNRISSKHFDYVICSPDRLSVVSVVELDDKSHSKGKRAERDRFIEGACSAAGITLHRFKAAASYNIAEVREVLFPPPEGEQTQEHSEHETPPIETGEERLCPKCSSVLVKKVAKKGEHKGSEFLACSAFPECRYISKSNT